MEANMKIVHRWRRTQGGGSTPLGSTVHKYDCRIVENPRGSLSYTSAIYLIEAREAVSRLAEGVRDLALGVRKGSVTVGCRICGTDKLGEN